MANPAGCRRKPANHLGSAQYEGFRSGTGRMWRYIKILLLGLGLLHLASFGLLAAGQVAGREGLLLTPGNPIGGDFINLFAAARLTLASRFADIFDPALFASYQASLVPGEIGVRLWAYPPTSLFLAAPFGLADFVTALILWSVGGLLVLAYGARRIGLGWLETAILLLSPGAVHSVYYGQTGNIATGLLLVALATWRPGILKPGLAAALLTIKPQAGFLIALDWLIGRRWGAIVVAIGATLLLVGVSLLAFGPAAWVDYVTKSLPFLQQIEREGSGPFLYMIPSLFIAGRVLGLSPDLAFALHLGFAAIVFALLVWRLAVTGSPQRRAVLVLFATPLISPYLHSYDLALVAAGALLLGRDVVRAMRVPDLLVGILVVLGWALANILLGVNEAGVPIAPLIGLALFASAAALPEGGLPEKRPPARP